MLPRQSPFSPFLNISNHVNKRGRLPSNITIVCVNLLFSNFIFSFALASLAIRVIFIIRSSIITHPNSAAKLRDLTPPGTRIRLRLRERQISTVKPNNPFGNSSLNQEKLDKTPKERHSDTCLS